MFDCVRNCNLFIWTNVGEGLNIIFFLSSSCCSKYPAKRVEKDGSGVPMGVPGTVDLLQNCTLSTQPISSFDWSSDKQGLAVCTAFDESVRVLIVTKLNLY